MRLRGITQLSFSRPTPTKRIPDPHLHLAVEGRLVLIYRFEYRPVHAPGHVVPDFKDRRRFRRVVAVDLVGRVEVRHRNEDRRIIIPLAFRCYRRRPVPAARRARVDTGVRADGLARHARNGLSPGNLLDDRFIILLHVEGHVVLAVVDAEGEDGWYGGRPRRGHGRRRRRW